ncbi:glycosyltransferase [Candidatus Micrarchaeota archaeon]|nr:glycosyltransferase [Candidatus Micrarchaeota archaeon]
MVEFSVVLPAHDEAKRLEKAVRAARRVLKGTSFEVLIAEDGSADGTADVGRKLAKRFSNVRCFSFKGRLGRGRALAQAFFKSKGKFVGYMDVDLATDPEALRRVLPALVFADVVVGSRYVKESRASRSFTRDVFSKVYNAWVRLWLGSRVSDHQCGFKFFKKNVGLRLCAKAKANHWFWDTEVLVWAQRLKLNVVEVPVAWREKEEGSKVNLFRDAWRMGSDVVGLWWRLRS